jgi:hypothetical protein
MNNEPIQKLAKLVTKPILRENVIDKKSPSLKKSRLVLKSLHTRVEDGLKRVASEIALERIRSRQGEPKTNRNAHVRVARRTSETS